MREQGWGLTSVDIRISSIPTYLNYTFRSLRVVHNFHIPCDFHKLGTEEPKESGTNVQVRRGSSRTKR